MRRPAVGFVCALGLALLEAGVLRASGDTRVVVISPHNAAIRFELGRGFAAWHRAEFGEPATVEWRDLGGSSDCLRFVQSEFAAKPSGIGIDLFFGGGPEPYLLLSEKGWLVTNVASPAVLEGIPQSSHGITVYDANRAWYGAVLSGFGILQNLRVQAWKGLPRVLRWEDLGQPELEGWVGAGDPRNSGTMNNMYEAILQAYGWGRGWRLLTAIGGNVRRFDRVSSSTAKDVTLGQTAYAFAIDFYGFTQVAAAGRTNLAFVLPNDFTAVSADGIAVLKGAPNRETARRFVDFVLSEAGQRLWFLPRGHPEGPQRYSIERMSVRPDFYRRYRGASNIEASPFELNEGFRYDPGLARTRREVVADLFGATIVDVHRELRRAWRALRLGGTKPADVDRLGEVPLSEAEALNLAQQGWRDPLTRARLRADWQQWARAKYRNLEATRSVH